MSLVWTEKDDNHIEALKILVKEKGSLTVPDDGTNVHIVFDVVDYYKANAFIMDIFSIDGDMNEDITGIRVKAVGFLENRDKQKQAMEYIKKAYELLSQ